MEITVGAIPVIVRQLCSAAFAGLIPEGTDGVGTVEYVPNILTVGGFEYAYEDNPLLKTLTQGGLFTFNDAVRITEIRAYCPALSTITVAVCDADGTHSVNITVAASADDTRTVYLDLPLLAGQSLKITTTAAGTIDVYAVKADSLWT